MITRRLFLKHGALSALGLTTGRFFFGGKLFAAEPARPGKILVVVFQRGAMDGLSMLPPVGDTHYLEGRPNVALKAGGDVPPIALDGHFALHPSLEPLKRFWDEGTLTFVPQSGSPDPTRSHFDAQDFMEVGTPGVKSTGDGFLNRAMEHVVPRRTSPVRAVAMQPNMPRCLAGKFPAISMGSIHEFAIRGALAGGKEVAGFETMYQQAADRVFRGIGSEAFEALRAVRQASGDAKPRAAEERGYPKQPIGRRLGEIAELIKADVGLQLAVTDMGGWDTHVNQGAGKGQLAERLRELGGAIAAFAADLGPRFSDVVVVTLTEFGRTVKENGNRGTDHGHGSVIMALGGPVAGKRVRGHWKDLSPANLFEGRDAPVTTDFRDVLGEVLRKHLGCRDLAAVFPKHDASPARHVGVIRG